MNLQRQTIWIKKECHLFPCEVICPNRLTLDSHLGQFFYGFFYTFHSESQMSQTAGFRSVHPLRGILFCKNLKFCVLILPNHFKAELLDVEFSGSFNIGNNDCNVMYRIQLHNSTPSALSHRWKLYLPSSTGNALRYSALTLASISSAFSGSISAMQQPLKPAPEKRPP